MTGNVTMNISMWAIVGLFMSGTIGAGILLLLWWFAFFNDWQVAWAINRLGEHWIEGVLFHIFAFVVISAWIQLFRKPRSQRF